MRSSRALGVRYPRISNSFVKKNSFNPSVAHGWFCCTFAQRVTAQTKLSPRAAEGLLVATPEPTDLAVISF